MILAAIFRYDSFSWTQNWLSDLGSDQDDVAALFNPSLMACATLTVIFAIGLKSRFTSTRGSAGAIALFVGALALFFTAVFPSTEGVEFSVHYYVSGLFQGLLIVSLVLIGAAMMGEPLLRRLGFFVLTIGVFASVAGVALFVVNQLSPLGGAIPEFLISFGASVCYSLVGLTLFTRASLRVA